MQKIFFSAMASVLVSFSSSAWAQDYAPAGDGVGAPRGQHSAARQAFREKMQAASPEERKAMHQQFMQEHPEQAAKMQARREERQGQHQAFREKMQAASPEERQGMRQQFRQQHPQGAQGMREHRQERRLERRSAAPTAQ